MVDPVNDVRTEQPAEEQDFRDEKEPNSQLARVELLLHRLEVVSLERRVTVMVPLCMLGVIVGFDGGAHRANSFLNVVTLGNEWVLAVSDANLASVYSPLPGL